MFAYALLIQINYTMMTRPGMPAALRRSPHLRVQVVEEVDERVEVIVGEQTVQLRHLPSEERHAMSCRSVARGGRESQINPAVQTARRRHLRPHALPLELVLIDE